MKSTKQNNKTKSSNNNTLVNNTHSTTNIDKSMSLNFQNILLDETSNIENTISNNESNDSSYQRKLREKVFLAEVLNIEKIESEKSFRTSEIYLGYDILSNDEVDILKNQRNTLAKHKVFSEFKNNQGRNLTEKYASSHVFMKAGASIDVSRKLQSDLQSKSIVTFDINRNDLWVKRMNTLRKFISLVSKWIIRNRMKKRCRKIFEFLVYNNLYTREAVREFIDKDQEYRRQQAEVVRNEAEELQKIINDENVNSENMINPIVAQVEVETTSRKPDVLQSFKKPRTISDFVCALPISYDYVSVAINASINNPKDVVNITDQVIYDVDNEDGDDNDSTQSMKKIKKKKRKMKKSSKSKDKLEKEDDSSLPPLNLYLTTSIKDVESGSRVPVSLDMTVDHLRPYKPLVPPTMFEERIARMNLTALASSIPLNNWKDSNPSHPNIDCCFDQVPIWIESGEETSDDVNIDEINFMKVFPDYRTYIPEPYRCEMDDDWILRPYSSYLSYSLIEDDSLRTKFLKGSNFDAMNMYLFNGVDNRTINDFKAASTDKSATKPIDKLTNSMSSSTPTLSTIYVDEHDRYVSGLHCYETDHLRGLFHRDLDFISNDNKAHRLINTANTSKIPKLAFIQSKPNPNDYLSESESDDEDLYKDSYKYPSDEAVKSVLQLPVTFTMSEFEENVVTANTTTKKDSKKEQKKEPKKDTTKDKSASKDASKEAKDLSINTSDYVTKYDFDDDDVKNRRVELVRDKMMIELERYRLKQKHEQMMKISLKLCEISQLSTCVVNALPAQVPFHVFEEYALKQHGLDINTDAK